MKLSEHFLCEKVFSEHHSNYDINFRFDKSFFEENGCFNVLPPPLLFKEKKDCFCFAINENRTVTNSYYIGVDWIIENTKAVYVQPKINKVSSEQLDYLGMLFQAFKDPEVLDHTADLVHIKWDKTEIKINQQQDLLTPLLILQFLQVVKNIVRKGLKKSYYKIEQNLPNRVKGKILVAKNIKQNFVKARTLNTYCAFEEFGFNGIENRIIKKALIFVERYLPTYKGLGSKAAFTETFNFIQPAFDQVSDVASLHECKNIKPNVFYKEYSQAIYLAKQILKRFGYNIQNASSSQISTPPFWIDMSKLFELYVLGLLKEKFGKDILYSKKEAKGHYGLPDYLLKKSGMEMVIDAKYKLQYDDFNEDESERINSTYAIENIRQISGYARDNKILDKITKDKNQVVDCLIIYPFRRLGKTEGLKFETKEEIKQFHRFYKLGVRLPCLEVSKKL